MPTGRFGTNTPARPLLYREGRTNGELGEQVPSARQPGFELSVSCYCLHQIDEVSADERDLEASITALDHWLDVGRA
jgi:hypothetical protein